MVHFPASKSPLESSPNVTIAAVSNADIGDSEANIPTSKISNDIPTIKPVDKDANVQPAQHLATPSIPTSSTKARQRDRKRSLQQQQQQQQSKILEEASALCAKGRKAWSNGETQSAILLFENALRLLECHLGTYHILTAKTYFWLGFLRKHNPQTHAAALKDFCQTARIRIVLLGSKHESTQEALAAITWVLSAQNSSRRHQQQQQQQQQQQRRQQPGQTANTSENQLISLPGDNSIRTNMDESNDDEDVCMIKDYILNLQESIRLETLGDAQLRQRNYSAAIEYYQKAMETFDDPNHATIFGKLAFCSFRSVSPNGVSPTKETSSSQSNTAGSTTDTSHLEQAILWYRQALQIFSTQSAHGNNHPDIPTTLERMRQVLMEYRTASPSTVTTTDLGNKDLPLSLPLVQQQQQIQRYTQTIVLKSIQAEQDGMQALKQGQISQALSCWKQSLDLEQSALGTQHPIVQHLEQRISTAEKFLSLLSFSPNSSTANLPTQGIKCEGNNTNVGTNSIETTIASLQAQNQELQFQLEAIQRVVGFGDDESLASEIVLALVQQHKQVTHTSTNKALANTITAAARVAPMEHDRIQRLQQQVSEYRTANSQLESQNSVLQAKLTQLEDVCTGYRANTEQAESSISKLKETLSVVNEECTQLKAQQEQSQQTIANLEHQVRVANATIATLESERESMRDTLKRESARIIELEQFTLELQTKMETTEMSLEKSQSHTSVAKEQLHRALEVKVHDNEAQQRIVLSTTSNGCNSPTRQQDIALDCHSPNPGIHSLSHETETSMSVTIQQIAMNYPETEISCHSHQDGQSNIEAGMSAKQETRVEKLKRRGRALAMSKGKMVGVVTPQAHSEFSNNTTDGSSILPTGYVQSKSFELPQLPRNVPFDEGLGDEQAHKKHSLEESKFAIERDKLKNQNERALKTIEALSKELVALEKTNDKLGAKHEKVKRLFKKLEAVNRNLKEKNKHLSLNANAKAGNCAAIVRSLEPTPPPPPPKDIIKGPASVSHCTTVSVSAELRNCVRLTQSRYTSALAEYILRKPFGEESLETGTLFVNSSCFLPTDIYAIQAHVKQPFTFDVVAVVSADGAQLHITGHDTVLYRGTAGGWTDLGAISSRTEPLGFIPYTPSTGCEEQFYSLDEIVEEALIFRQHYCVTVLSRFNSMGTAHKVWSLPNLAKDQFFQTLINTIQRLFMDPRTSVPAVLVFVALLSTILYPGSGK